MGGCCFGEYRRSAPDTELEGDNKEERRLEEGVREGHGPKKCRSAIKKEYFVVLWHCGYHLPEYTVSKPTRTKSMHVTWWSGIIWWHFPATNAVTVLPVARYPDPPLSMRHTPRTRCLKRRVLYPTPQQCQNQSTESASGVLAVRLRQVLLQYPAALAHFPFSPPSDTLCTWEQVCLKLLDEIKAQ